MPRFEISTVIASVIAILVAVAAPPPALAQDEEATSIGAAAAQEAAAAARVQNEALERAILAQQDELNVQRGRGGGRVGRGGRGGRAGGFGRFTPELLEQLQQVQGIESATAREIMAQRGGRSGQGRATPAVTDIDAPPADEAKDVITVNVWVLTLSASRDQMADDLVAALAKKAVNLPPIVGSTDEVRELIEKLKVANLLESAREFRIMALDGQPGIVNTGEVTPRVSGVAVARGGLRSTGLNQVNIGTQIQVLPHVAGDGSLQVSVQYTMSDVEKAPDVEIAEGMLADRTKNQSTNTTVRLRSGTAVVVQSDSLTQAWGQVASCVRTQLILLGATVVPVLD